KRAAVQCVSTYRCVRVGLFLLQGAPPSEIYTLSLHDALPILKRRSIRLEPPDDYWVTYRVVVRRESAASSNDQQSAAGGELDMRSEEHTSELQSPCNLVCRLLLEKKKDISDQEPCVRAEHLQP